SSSLLALILDQFGQMQQEFLDQFQQTTLMMFRALGAMHRDQMEELREKLDSLHQLGENLQAFQAHMTAAVASGSGPPAHQAINPAPHQPASAGISGRGMGGIGRDNTSVAAPVPEPHSPVENGTGDLRAKLRPSVEQS